VKTICLFILCFPLTLLAQLDKQYTAALQSFEQGKYPECIAQCDEALQTHYKQAQIYLLRGRANIELGHYILAIDDLTTSIKRDPKNAVPYGLRGYCYSVAHEYKHARLDLIEACYLDSSSALYYYNLGNVEQRMMKLNEAIKSYTMAIKRKPEYAEAYINRGHIYLTRNDFTTAIRDLDSALKYQQSSEELFLYRGMALTSLKRNKEALDMFTRCIRLKPEDAAAYYNRGRVYYQMKDFRSAVANFDTAVTLKPAFEIAYFNRALALLEIDKSQRQRACDDLARAIELGFLEAVNYQKKYCE
jgi:tetratricopeptide (TPR) repeat protein